MNFMKIITLTGGMGSGKSTVLGIFKSFGALTLDCDGINHKQMLKGGSAYEKIVAEFGNNILDEDNEIDRKALSDIVFENQELLDKLTYITHNCIFDEIRKELSNMVESDVVVIEVPLLFQCEFPFEYDASVAVVADVDVRVRRVVERDGCTDEAALKRINKQLSDEEMRARADFVIENNGDEIMLKNKVKEIYNRI